MPPLYEYRRKDGEIIEVLQSRDEVPLTHCPETGQEVEKILSTSNPVFKGKGFYETDYKKKEIRK